MHVLHDRPYLHGTMRDALLHVSYFLSHVTRPAFHEGGCELVPNNFSEVPRLLRETTKCTLVAAAAAPMDRHGYFSLGTSCDYAAPFIGRVPFFLEVNPRMPRSFGRNQVHVSQVRRVDRGRPAARRDRPGPGRRGRPRHRRPRRRAGPRRDTPGKRFRNELHPEGVRETFAWFQLFWHPFRVLLSFRRVSGGVSRACGFNPRLISCTPSACVRVIAMLSFGFSALANDARPYAKVEPLAPGEARWTTGFWGDRFELCRTQMIPGMERLMEGTNYTHFLRNFEIAAGLAEGRYRGAPFNDGDFYKWMEAAIASLAVKKNPELEGRLDEIIAIIAKAQRGDGYLHTHVLVQAAQRRHQRRSVCRSE